MAETDSISNMYEKMMMSDVTVYNLYNHVTFNHIPEKSMLCVIWDYNNKDVNLLMENESLTRDNGTFCSHMWVDEIKQCSGWTEGNRLYLRTLYFYKGMFCVRYKHHSNDVYAYEEIDEDGFLLLRNYDDTCGYYGELHRVDCFHNKLHNA